MSTVKVSDFFEENGVIFYTINVRLPLRSIVVHRRFSEFLALVSALCSDVGIANSDFPYSLPGKGGVFTSKVKLAALRLKPLNSFVNEVVRDRDLQNRRAVHSFLELPRNFKFSAESFPKDSQDHINEKQHIHLLSGEVTNSSWLQVLRLARGVVGNMAETNGMLGRIADRIEIQRTVLPRLGELEVSLNSLLKLGEISSSEYSQRQKSLRVLKEEANKIIERTHGKGAWQGNEEQKPAQNMTPRETNDTIALSNKELLQRQQQVHQEQDQELDELRKALANQKRIGEAINKEVSEQNEILEALSREVDASSGKLESARSRTRKIG